MTLARNTPLRRSSSLEPGNGPERRTPLRAGKPKGKSAATRKPIKPVSDKRRAENRERRAMADRLWPDRREGTVMCGCGRPECHRPADDLHEPKFRSRLGSITDPENAIPVSRECHDWIHTHEQEAHELGLAVHSWE